MAKKSTRGRCLCVPLIVAGLWLAFRHHIDCLIFLEGPIIFIGITLFLTSIIGAVGVTKRKLVLIWTYLIILLFLLLLLFCFTLFVFFVSIGGGGHKTQRYTFKEYQVDDYSQWFQDKVTNLFFFGLLIMKENYEIPFMFFFIL